MNGKAASATTAMASPMAPVPPDQCQGQASPGRHPSAGPCLPFAKCEDNLRRPWPDADMLIDLPFSYECTLKRGGDRRSYRNVLHDVAPFAFGEVSSSEAPEVVTVDCPDPSRPGGRSAVTRRWHGGRLYVPLAATDADEPVTPEAIGAWLNYRLSQGELSRDRADLMTGRLPGGILPVLRKPTISLRSMAEARAVVAGGDGGAVRVFSDDRDEQLAEAHATYAGGLLAVDGEVWTSVETHEPWWVLSCTGIPASVRLGSRDISGPGEPTMSGVMAFRIDRLDDALACAEVVNARHGRAGVPQDGARQARVTVHDASLLRFDEAGHLARRFLRDWSSLRGTSANGTQFADVMRRFDETVARLAAPASPGTWRGRGT